MAFVKPIGDINYTCPGPEHNDKMTERCNYMAGLLEPHIRRFAEKHTKQVCRQMSQNPVEMAKESRKWAKEFVENPKTQEDEAVLIIGLLAAAKADGVELPDYIPEELKSNATKTAQEILSLSDDELIEREKRFNQEVEEKCVSDSCRRVTDILVEAVFHTCLYLFEEGARSLKIKELVEKIDFEQEGLTRELPAEYYPEIKGILRQMIPVLLKKSLVDIAYCDGRQTYFEIFYSDNLCKIIMHPVSWEIVQTWANS